jgi:hypothetical protein
MTLPGNISKQDKTRLQEAVVVSSAQSQQVGLRVLITRKLGKLHKLGFASGFENTSTGFFDCAFQPDRYRSLTMIPIG